MTTMVFQRTLLMLLKILIMGGISLNVDDGDGSLQLSVTQSQSVDGTEPVTQAEDVPM